MKVERILAKLLSRFDYLDRTPSFFLKEFPEELEEVKQKLVKKILLEVPKD